MAGTVTILPQDRKISVLIESFSIFFSSFFLFLNFAFSHFVYSYYCISALLLSSNFALPHFAGFDVFLVLHKFSVRSESVCQMQVYVRHSFQIR